MADVRAEERDARVDKVTLRRSLGDRLIGNRLLYFLTLTSTNEHVRELAEDGWPEGTVVLAEEQTAGKGRSGRAWHSPPGVGLYVSVLLKPSLAPEKIPLLTLLAAAAASQAVRDCGFQAAVKWPNDLMLGGRKIGGILADARLRPGAPAEVVVGIGLNVNHTEADFPPEILPRAGSLRIHSGAAADRTEVLTRVLLRLDDAYAALRSSGEASILDAFLGVCPMVKGVRVTVTGEGEPLAGETAGLTTSGALRLITSGGIREVRVGEVSVAEA